MPRRLPERDFRSIRYVMLPRDFALGSGREPKPTDLVDRETWKGITLLPDDVAVRTSNHNGHLLRILYKLWAGWVESLNQAQDPIDYGIYDASDELQACIYNALCGYYRQAVGCIRNAIEQFSICSYLQSTNRNTEFEAWQSGKLELSFGNACDGLIRQATVKVLTRNLEKNVKDSLFRQKSKDHEGGWARRLYSELSNYSHTRPGFTTSDMWQSNGPVYEEQSFRIVCDFFFKASCLGFLFVKIARDSFSIPKSGKESLASGLFDCPTVLIDAIRFLFRD